MRRARPKTPAPSLGGTQRMSFIAKPWVRASYPKARGLNRDASTSAGGSVEIAERDSSVSSEDGRVASKENATIGFTRQPGGS